MRKSKSYTLNQIKTALDARQIAPKSSLTNSFKYFRRNGVDLFDPDLDAAITTKNLPAVAGRGRSGCYRECTYLRVIVIQMLRKSGVKPKKILKLFQDAKIARKRSSSGIIPKTPLEENTVLEKLREMECLLDRGKDFEFVGNAINQKKNTCNDNKMKNLRNDTRSGYLYFFISSVASWEKCVRSFVRGELVDSAYHTSGISSWMFIVRVKSIEDVGSLGLDISSITFYSQTLSSEDCYEQFDNKDFDDAKWDSRITSLMFISVSKNTKLKKSIESWIKSCASVDFAPLRLFKVFGSFQYILEFQSSDHLAQFAFIRKCSKNRLVTCTKLALVTWKRCGDYRSYFVDNDSRLKSHEEIVASNVSVQRAVYTVLNSFPSCFINARTKEGLLIDCVSRWVPSVTPEEIVDTIKTMEVASKKLTRNRDYEVTVSRFTVQVIKPRWVYVLFFISAKIGSIIELEKKLCKYLKVDGDKVAVKLMRTAGKYDLIAPIYCRNDEAIESIKREWASAEYSRLIRGDVYHLACKTTNQVSSPTPSISEAGAHQLHPIELRLIEEIVGNTQSYGELLKNLNDVRNFSNRKANTAPKTPIARRLFVDFRPEMVKKFLCESPGWDTKQSVESMCFNLGLVPYVELNEHMQHALLWLYLSNKSSEEYKLDQDMVISKLTDIAKKNCIGLQLLKPIRRPMQLIVMVRYREPVELERLLYEIRNEKQYTKKIEFHVVYGQLFFESIKR